MSSVPYPVVVFDLDGTLLQGTSVSLSLAEWMDRGELIEDLERRFRAGEISNRHVADISAEWFTGVTLEEVWAELEPAPWIDGIEETIAALIAAGCRVLLGTVTWRFAAEMLQRRYGFHAVSGTEMGIEEGCLSGKVSRYFDEFDKLRFVEEWCREQGHTIAGVAAVGDSRSDVPLFERAGYAIALNATADARAAADVVIDTDFLPDVLDRLLPARPGAPAFAEGREREAKFAVDPQTRFPSLEVGGARVTEMRREQLETTYWDTPDGLLAGSRRSLRHRAGEGWTAKRELSSEDQVLNRLEEHFGGDATAPPRPAVAFLDAVGRAEELRPAVRLRVGRRRHDIRSVDEDALLVEMIDDDVTVLDAGGEQVGSFRELELEVVHPAGEPVLQELVARFVAAGIRSDPPMPKYERALSLLEERADV